jgi:hypothetical protein
MREEDLQKIGVAMMENALLEAGHIIEVPLFERPAIKANKMFKEVMNTFMGREPEPKAPRKKKVKDG